MDPKKLQIWTHSPNPGAPLDESVPNLVRVVWPDAHHIWVTGKLLSRRALSLQEDRISAKRGSLLLDAIIEILINLGDRVVVETAAPAKLELSGLLMSLQERNRVDCGGSTFLLLPEDPHFSTEAVELLFGMHRPWALAVMDKEYGVDVEGDARKWVEGVARHAEAVVTEYDGEMMDILIPQGKRVNDVLVAIMNAGLDMDYSVEYGP